MIFLCLILSAIIAAIFIIVRKWGWKSSLIFSCSAIILGVISSTIFYFVGERQNYYSEIWNYKIVRVEHYEDWDERVSCRHPKYKTVTHTDSKGNTYTTTEQDGYHHAYDVDYHPEYWAAVDEYKDDHRISQQTYNNWKRIWSNEVFIDMKRDYHSDDGDMYRSIWNGEFDKLFPWEHVQDYQNKIRKSQSVFKFKEVEEETTEKYWRPSDEKKTNSIFSYDGQKFSSNEDIMIRRVNATLGRNEKVHSMIFLWDGNKNPMSIMDEVLGAWKGPNKNELIIAIGIDSSRNILWTRVDSWCSDTTIHALIRQDIDEIKILDFEKVKNILLNRIPSYWDKKSFSETFEYIRVPTPNWCYVWNSIIIIVLGVAAGLLFVFNLEEELEYY